MPFQIGEQLLKFAGNDRQLLGWQAGRRISEKLEALLHS